MVVGEMEGGWRKTGQWERERGKRSMCLCFLTLYMYPVCVCVCMFKSRRMDLYIVATHSTTSTMSYEQFQSSTYI